MPEFDSKYLNTYLNGITYENAFWKSRFNDLWYRFLYLQNENQTLQNLLNECNSMNENTTENTTENTSDTTKNSNHSEIISHLQKKNSELLKNLMDKSKDVFILQGELEKYKVRT